MAATGLLYRGDDGARFIDHQIFRLSSAIAGFNALRQRESYMFSSGLYTLTEIYDEMEGGYQAMGKMVTNTVDAGTADGLADELDDIGFTYAPQAKPGDLFVDWNVDADDGTGDSVLIAQTIDPQVDPISMFEIDWQFVAGMKCLVTNAEDTANNGVFTVKTGAVNKKIKFEEVMTTDNVNDSTLTITVIEKP